MKIKEKKLSKLIYSEYVTGYLFVMPMLLLLGIWFYYPSIRSLIYSFQDISFLTPDKAKFIGIRNYIEILKDPVFYQALKNSLVLTLVVVPLQSVIALVIAANLNSITRMKGFFRTLYYMPYITSTVAVTIVFMYMFVERSAVINFFSMLGLPNVSWYANVKMALPFLCMLIIWTFVGFYVVVYLAALQGIPVQLYEAGEVDGATSFQKFIYITFPILKPTTFLVVISGLLNAMQTFDQPYALARMAALGTPAGTTSTLIVYFYNESFRFNRAGYGSSAAFIVFVILLAISITQKYFFERDKGAAR